MKRQFEIEIRGRVQGVGFRHHASKEARALGLKGSVENLPDGSVRAVIQGDENTCMAFLRWCHQGPPYSWVEKVDYREVSCGEVGPFRIRY